MATQQPIPADVAYAARLNFIVRNPMKLNVAWVSPSMKRFSRAEALLLGLPILRGHADEFEKQAKANLVVAAVRAAGSPCSMDDLAAAWTKMSFGLAPRSGLEASLEDAVSLEFLTQSDGMVVLAPDLSTETMESRIRKVYPAFEKFLKVNWGEDYDPGLHGTRFKDTFDHCMKRFLMGRIEATLASSEAESITHEALAHLFSEVAKDFAVHRARDFGDSLVIWMTSKPAEIWPLVRDILTLIATVHLFDAHNQFGGATKDALRGTTLALDSNVVVQLLCPHASPSWNETTKETLAIARKYECNPVISRTYIRELDGVVEAALQGLDHEDSEWFRMDNQLVLE